MTRANEWPCISALAATLVLGLTAVTARAQPADDSRFGAGIGLTLGLPQDEFREHADVALGLNGYVVIGLARPAGLALRLEGLLLDYGGGRWPLDVRGTINPPALEEEIDHLIIAPLIGPQLGARRGSARPYVNVGVGPAFFLTTEEVKLRDSAFLEDEESIGGSTVADDVAFAWAFGGGLWARVGGRVHITISAQYMSNSPVRYLADGLVQSGPGGFVRLDPVESRVNLVLLQVGVAGLIR